MRQICPRSSPNAWWTLKQIQEDYLKLKKDFRKRELAKNKDKKKKTDVPDLIISEKRDGFLWNIDENTLDVHNKIKGNEIKKQEEKKGHSCQGKTEFSLWQ